MATGVEHYREAERLLALADGPPPNNPLNGAGLRASAQVHATLASAAATALGHLVNGGPMEADRGAWIAAASEHPAYLQRLRDIERAELAEQDDIREEDLDVSTVRPGGHDADVPCLTTGEFDTYVRITHRPTGITVERDSERSQLQNKANALAALRQRLALLDELGPE